jgi:hypothetical protein
MLKKICILLLISGWQLLAGHSCAATDIQKPFYVDSPYFQGENRMDVEEVKAFFYKLKNAIDTDDDIWLGENISYPMKVSRDGKVILISSARVFKENYELVINKEIREAIECQEFDDLFVNWEGIMVGQGAVWFRLMDIAASKSIEKPGGSSITPSPEGEVGKTLNLSDRSRWKYKIFAISDDDPVKQFVKRCDNRNQSDRRK